MKGNKNKVFFIISVVAMVLFALLAASGAIIYYAKATSSPVLPLALGLAGLAGVIVSMAVMFAVIPKNK